MSVKIMIGTNLCDAFGRKRDVPVGRPFLTPSGLTRIGGYTWRVADLCERFWYIV
jgi:hypothetical protein